MQTANGRRESFIVNALLGFPPAVRIGQPRVRQATSLPSCIFRKTTSALPSRPGPSCALLSPHLQAPSEPCQDHSRSAHLAGRCTGPRTRESRRHGHRSHVPQVPANCSRVQHAESPEGAPRCDSSRPPGSSQSRTALAQHGSGAARVSLPRRHANRPNLSDFLGPPILRIKPERICPPIVPRVAPRTVSLE